MGSVKTEEHHNKLVRREMNLLLLGSGITFSFSVSTSYLFSLVWGPSLIS